MEGTSTFNYEVAKKKATLSTKFNKDTLLGTRKALKEAGLYPDIEGLLKGNETAWVLGEDVDMRNATIAGIKAEVYTAKNGEVENTILFFHGGGYVSGITNMYRDIAQGFVRLFNGSRVVMFEYSVAPNKFPTAQEEAFKVYKEVAKDVETEHFFAIGDSAGGNLCVLTVHKAVKEGLKLPKKVFLSSAWGDLGCDLPSRQYNRYRDLFLGVSSLENPTFEDLLGVQAYRSDYLNNQEESKLPEISPVLIDDFTGFPSTLMVAGQNELLLSDTLVLYELMTISGVECNLHVEKGMSHDFALTGTPEGNKVLGDVKEFFFS